LLRCKLNHILVLDIYKIIFLFSAVDREGNSCLHFAAKKGRLEILSLLLDVVDPLMENAVGENGFFFFFFFFFLFFR